MFLLASSPAATTAALEMLEKLPVEVVARGCSVRNIYRYIFDVVYMVHWRNKGGSRDPSSTLYQTPLLLGPPFPGFKLPGGVEFEPGTQEQEEFALGLVGVHLGWMVEIT